jgi:hypothetical protein
MKTVNVKPTLRLADGFEERALCGHDDPLMLLTLLEEQVLLTSEDAMSLACSLTGLNSMFFTYARAMSPLSVVDTSTGCSKIIVQGENCGNT